LRSPQEVKKRTHGRAKDIWPEANLEAVSLITLQRDPGEEKDFPAYAIAPWEKMRSLSGSRDLEVVGEDDGLPNWANRRRELLYDNA